MKCPGSKIISTKKPQIWIRSEVDGNKMQRLCTNSSVISYAFDKIYTFGNKLTTKSDDFVRFFFRNRGRYSSGNGILQELSETQQDETCAEHISSTHHALSWN